MSGLCFYKRSLYDKYSCSSQQALNQKESRARSKINMTRRNQIKHLVISTVMRAFCLICPVQRIQNTFARRRFFTYEGLTGPTNTRYDNEESQPKITNNYGDNCFHFIDFYFMSFRSQDLSLFRSVISEIGHCSSYCGWYFVGSTLPDFIVSVA